jgi:hypothetical protein
MRRTALLVAATVAAVVAGALAVLAAPAAPASASSAPPGDADRWAVVVGVTHYQGRTHPTAAGADDAADVRDALLASGFPSDHVVTLTEGDATAANVRGALQWLVDHSGPRSLSVFHFSGHVKQMSGDRDHDGEKVDEFLWPVDNRFIADGELAGYARQLRGWAWIDIAGCEAAGFDDGISSDRRLFTASSGESEKSYEQPDWHNSVFTGLEVDQGLSHGQADADGDGRVSLQEAFAYAASRAPQITKAQKRGPQHPATAGGGDSPWFLAPPPSPPAQPSSGGGGCLLLCG